MREYDRKRDFSQTPEPDFSAGGNGTGALRFVIQRHDARRLHYDLRLECEGALKSWAVPKGPSLDPSIKRAAIMVEDHPLEYANFEGKIPEGNYGAGEVIIWDEGTYVPEGGTGDRGKDESLILKGLKEGKLHVALHGKRLHGEFVLVRKAKTQDWLLIKVQDAFATTEDPTRATSSVRSGLTSDEVRRGSGSDAVEQVLRELAGSSEARVPDSPKAMLPGEAERPFVSDLWTWEPKLDGVRVLAVKEGSSVKLITRNQIDIAERFPHTCNSIRQLPDASCVLDGELVVNDERGRPNFQLLMDAYHSRRDPHVLFWVFDLTYLRGFDLKRCTLADRRRMLERLALAGNVKLVPTFPSDGKALFDQAVKLGMEGIVGKRLASRYREGPSGDDWVKVKGYHTEEFLVGGFTKGSGVREAMFGALLLGRRDEEGDLIYCGNVGGGFSDTQLTSIRADLDPLRIPISPFAEALPTKDCVFVRPELVAEVRFMGWTRERRLRFPIFQRLRPDVTEPAPMPGSVASPKASNGIVEALNTKAPEVEVEVDGYPIRLTSLNKELWPGLTKRDLIRYLVRVSDAYLYHLKDRPVTFVRYPDGIAGEGFFQRHIDKGLPEFVATADVFSGHNGGARQLLLCNNLATLVWLGQMAAIELHPWHARANPEGTEGAHTRYETEEELESSALGMPDYLVCDLDPNIRSGNEAPGAEPELNAVGWARTVEVALHLRELLGLLKLRGYVKTTGKTGIHVYVPLVRVYTHDQVREAARTIAKFMLDRHPKLITTELRLAKRPDKVFFDANMNGKAKTLASVFSPRPVPGGRVSFPITWDELSRVKPEDFTIETVPELMEARGDAWAGMLSDGQRMGV